MHSVLNNIAHFLAQYPIGCAKQNQFFSCAQPFSRSTVPVLNRSHAQPFSCSIVARSIVSELNCLRSTVARRSIFCAQLSGHRDGKPPAALHARVILQSATADVSLESRHCNCPLQLCPWPSPNARQTIHVSLCVLPSLRLASFNDVCGFEYRISKFALFIRA